jgi:type IV pilus assembly protein PilN
MIRINLLGQARPKALRRAVPLEATLQILLLGLSLLFALGVLWFHWYQLTQDGTKKQQEISKLQSEKSRLENLKAQVDAFEVQKKLLQQRINVIEELQRNRTGGSDLLDSVANTVSRTDALWLNSITRKGNALTIDGSAASINAVANFITQLKRSGKFDQVEIKESHEDDKLPGVQTFVFSLLAQFAQPQNKAAAPAQPGKS